MTDERISEYELDGEFIPMHWSLFFVTGFIALLTGYWLSAIIAVAVFVLAVMHDIKSNNDSDLSFIREAIND